jgi:hypothetical protein
LPEFSAGMASQIRAQNSRESPRTLVLSLGISSLCLGCTAELAIMQASKTSQRGSLREGVDATSKYRGGRKWTIDRHRPITNLAAAAERPMPC